MNLVFLQNNGEIENVIFEPKMISLTNILFFIKNRLQILKFNLKQ